MLLSSCQGTRLGSRAASTQKHGLDAAGIGTGSLKLFASQKEIILLVINDYQGKENHREEAELDRKH